MELGGKTPKNEFVEKFERPQSKKRVVPREKEQKTTARRQHKISYYHRLSLAAKSGTDGEVWRCANKRGRTAS